MLDISPRQLQAFIAIGTTHSVRAAAEKLHLTQPAVSMALAELERRLDVLLFTRTRGRLHLSERGRELLPLAREILDRLRDLQQRATGEARQLTGELRIGASNTVGNYLVAELLGPFSRAHPHISIHLRVGNTGNIAAAVRDQEVDIGCVEGMVSDADLDLQPWRRDALVVCAPVDHPLTHKARLRRADFSGVRWIMREHGSATRTQTERALANLPPGQVVLELGQTEAIKQAVIAGLGIAVLPRVAIAGAAAMKQLQVLHTPFLNLERRLSLVLKRDAYRGALLNAFLAGNGAHHRATK